MKLLLAAVGEVDAGADDEVFHRSGNEDLM
jgi:hypothetical protein